MNKSAGTAWRVARVERMKEGRWGMANFVDNGDAVFFRLLSVCGFAAMPGSGGIIIPCQPSRHEVRIPEVDSFIIVSDVKPGDGNYPEAVKWAHYDSYVNAPMESEIRRRNMIEDRLCAQRRHHRSVAV